MVEAENSGGDLTNDGAGNNLDADQSKVIRPAVNAGMKKTAEFAALPADRANIATFGPIAKQAGISQITRRGRATMLFTDDVIDLAAPKGVVFMNQAVFTEVIGAMTDQSPQFNTDVADAHESGADGRGPWPNA